MCYLQKSEKRCIVLCQWTWSGSDSNWPSLWKHLFKSILPIWHGRTLRSSFRLQTVKTQNNLRVWKRFADIWQFWKDPKHKHIFRIHGISEKKIQLYSGTEEIFVSIQIIATTGIYLSNIGHYIHTNIKFSKQLSQKMDGNCFGFFKTAKTKRVGCFF